MKRYLLFAILLFVFSFNSAEAAGENEIPFDFPELKQEDIAKRYQIFRYKQRKNPHFRYEMVFPKDWKIIKIKDPAAFPEKGVPVEIGAYHRFQVPDDPKSEILAGLYVSAVRVPSEWSDAKAVDQMIVHLLKGHSFKNLKMREYKLSGRTLKDILFTYRMAKGKTYWSRITGFKVKDETRMYAAGGMDILYLVQLHTSERDYRAFAAEAFYVAKTTLRILDNL